MACSREGHCDVFCAASSATQHVWLFRVEQLLAEDGVLVARFYCNGARSLQQPLQLRRRAVQLRLGLLSGVCYTLAPEREWEVLRQLSAAQYSELLEQVFEGPGGG